MQLKILKLLRIDYYIRTISISTVVCLSFSIIINIYEGYSFSFFIILGITLTLVIVLGMRLFKIYHLIKENYNNQVTATIEKIAISGRVCWLTISYIIDNTSYYKRILFPITREVKTLIQNQRLNCIYDISDFNNIYIVELI